VYSPRPLLALQKSSANDAKDHVGEMATVCCEVVSTRYASSTKGQPTFLNLDKPYPNQVFTVLIWEARQRLSLRMTPATNRSVRSCSLSRDIYFWHQQETRAWPNT
jgi:hypothetical protein